MTDLCYSCDNYVPASTYDPDTACPAECNWPKYPAPVECGIDKQAPQMPSYQNDCINCPLSPEDGECGGACEDLPAKPELSVDNLPF
jgi:hypothetical protein